MEMIVSYFEPKTKQVTAFILLIIVLVVSFSIIISYMILKTYSLPAFTTPYMSGNEPPEWIFVITLTLILIEIIVVIMIIQKINKHSKKRKN